ncbi:Cytosolic sulfotransferase 17 [Bienertia sinuspersici]
MNRTLYDYSTHPLLTSSPHDCVPSIEFSNNLCAFPSLVCAHVPFPLLPECIKSDSSSCPIVYVCRDPKDVFVSLWHFTNKVRVKELPPLGIEEAFDLFCRGISPFGSYWDHVLAYWNASVLMPNKVLFLRYEDMKAQPIAILKRLGEFIGCAFSYDEENDGVIQKIVDFCSFDNLTSFQVNQTPTQRTTMSGTNMANNMFFRKGKVGDYKNYMTQEMIMRLKEITEMSFKGSGLQLWSDADA